MIILLEIHVYTYYIILFETTREGINERGKGGRLMNAREEAGRARSNG